MNAPHPARTAAEWLSLAAAPTFAIMALLTHFAGGNMPCSAAAGASPLNGMAAMYLLMSAFHATSWLRLIRPGQRPAPDQSERR